MASFGRGAPRQEFTAEEQEILTDLKSLTIINDRQKDENISSWGASFVIPEGGRRRPLMKITDYKIPKIEGMEPDSPPQSVPKRVGKGRSRILHKTRDAPLNLGLNREFEMYNRVPCGDNNLQFFNMESCGQESGYSFPSSPISDKGHGDSNLSGRSKVSVPNYPQEALYSQPSNTERFNSILHQQVDQFSCNNDFSVHSNDKGNYDDNILANPSNTNGNDGSVSELSTFNDDQFQDYDDVLSSNLEPASINKVLPNALNCTNGLATAKCVLKNTCLLPNKKEMVSSLNDASFIKDDSCLSERESSLTVIHQPESVQPLSVNTSSVLDSSSGSAKSDILEQCTQGSKAKSIDLLPQQWNELTNSKIVPSSALDWWSDPENENCQSKLSSNTAPHKDQFEDELCAVQTKLPDANNFRFNDSLSTSNHTIDPNRSPHKKTKAKLTSYNHAQESQSKNGKNLTLVNDSQRRPTLGWGDTSYRNALGPKITPCEPNRNLLQTTTSIRRVVSAYGDAERFSANCSVNAFMKPTRRPDPVFSMEDDFPALQPNRNINESSTSKNVDNWAELQHAREETSSTTPVNDVPPEEAKELINFDQHSIVIENLPPNSENNLREFLEPFVKVLSISVFSVDTGDIAYVRLENDDHCEWLIDCFDGSVPGMDWSAPLKIKKLI